MNNVFAVQGILLNINLFFYQSTLSLYEFGQSVGMSSFDTLKVLSVNCQGLQNKKKQVHVLPNLKEMQPKKDGKSMRDIWKENACLMAKSRGVRYTRKSQ